jgi:hypothetical protein
VATRIGQQVEDGLGFGGDHSLDGHDIGLGHGAERN